MNDLRDRIRDAADAVGETVTREDLPAAPAALRTRRRPRTRWVGPLVAAAAVLAVVAATLAVRLTDHTGPTRPTHPTHPVGGVPGFYVDANRRAQVDVRSVDTGKVVSTAGRGVLHGKTSWEVAAAAPDNRHFYLATTGCVYTPKVYELVLDDRGRVRSFHVTGILLAKGTKVVDLDATSDRKVVGVQESCRGDKPDDVFTANLKTHTYGTSTFNDLPSGSDIDRVSESEDGRSMLLSIGHPVANPTFLLVTKHSDHPVTLRGKYGSVRGAVLEAWLTPDGGSLVGYVSDTGLAGGPSGPDYGLLRYTLSGKPTRTLAHWPKRRGADWTICGGYGDRWLVTLSGNGHTRLGWVQGSAYHALPNAAGANVEVGVFAW